MEAEANSAAVPTQEKGNEFIVHTKHTCDKCFQQPILGKRYKSSVHDNFDLCSRCFDAYTGPEIGLTEIVLARDNKQSREFVLKLKIDEGGDVQVRRIKVSDVWDSSLSSLSFGKMMSVASNFTGAKDKDDFISKAKATYIDEDGDEIRMTSDKELEDAFLQVLKKFPIHKPFVITVGVPQDKPDNVYAASGRAAGMPKRIQLRKVEPSKKPLFTVSNQAMMGAGKSKTTLRVTPQTFEKDFFVHARHTCDGCQRTPIIGTRYHAMNIPDFDLCANCFEKYEGEKSDFQPEIHHRDRRMQQRWLKKQLSDSAKTCGNIAAEWSKASGDLVEFLKRVQQAGGEIESATVLRQSSPCQGHSSSAPKASEEEAASTEKVEEKATGSDDKASESPDEVKETAKAKEDASVEKPSAENAPRSPAASHDGSFLSEADGNGSLAEAIGRTLDVCVAAFEDAMVDVEKGDIGADSLESSEGKSAINDVAAAADVAADAFSVASSMVSSMTDVLRKMEESERADGVGEGRAVMSQSKDDEDAGATVLKSVDDSEAKRDAVKVEDASEDEWSVVSDDKKDGVCKSVSSVEPLSPVVLAKWDTELHQLHELGFLDDRRNVNALEHLEAAHMGVDSTDKVTVNAVVEHLLG